MLFEQAVRWSSEHGYRTFIESSPHPVLTAGIRESLEDYDADHSVVETLRRNDGGIRRFLAERDESLGERCRAHVAAHYDWLKVIERVEQVFVQVVREGPGHGRR